MAWVPTTSNETGVTFDNCRSSVVLHLATNGDATSGGFIGNAGRCPAFFQNCLFDGSFEGSACHSIGGFAGMSWKQLTFNNCLVNPQGLPTTALDDYRSIGNTFTRYGGSAPNYKNSYYTTSIGVTQGTYSDALTAEQLARQLGANWELQGGQVVPVMTRSDDPTYSTLLWDERAQVVLTTDKYASTSRLISTAADWKAFAQDVAKAGGKYPVDAILMADFTTDVRITTVWQGTLEGNGHTITLNIDDTRVTMYKSLFDEVEGNATIRNLNIAGTMRGGSAGGGYLAGLVGYYKHGGGRLTIENCRVSAEIVSAGGYVSGFIANAYRASDVTIRNCLFDGKLTQENTGRYKMNGATYIVSGDGDNNTPPIIENCLDQGTYTGFPSNGVAFAYNYYVNRFSTYTNCWTYTANNWPGVDYAGGKSASDMAAVLGSQWKVDYNGKAVPVQGRTTALYTERKVLSAEEVEQSKLKVDLTSSCVDHFFSLSVEQGSSSIPPLSTDLVDAVKKDSTDLATYRFDNNAELVSLEADTLQNGVSLSWEVGEGGVDYFRILRYDKLTPEVVDTLEAAYVQTAYIDRTARPQHNYVYTVLSVTQCEGEHLSQMTVEGCCQPTGMVRGYVRLADGTGMAGRTVTATPNDITGASIGSCVTDSTGYFEIGDLIYGTEGSYTLTVNTKGDESPFDKQIVTFDDAVGGNLKTNVVFTQSTYYVFSGYVLYEGSSIPVSGAHFLLDGAMVMNASGNPVETDLQGSFSVSIPQGAHSVQVVKDGHVFMNEGFYEDPDMPEGKERQHNWQSNLYEHYFWDQTKVVLRGRVVGGNDQGLKPLGESLSRNNLGDNLTITMKLEGDNASWIVRDQLDDNVKERDLTFLHGKSDTTQVHMTRQTITIHPDAKTGEYEVKFYPVKYKITEIYATGYPTLFATGTAAETLDLTDCVQGDTAVYSRIYHTPATLHYEQLNIRVGDDYFGLKSYTALDVAGAKSVVTLWDKEQGYAMGHPVFMAGSPIPLIFSAREEYYYNNVQNTVPDVVKLGGGTVKIQNGLISSTETETIELDSLGEGSYIFTPQNTTFTLENDAALRTMTVTLLYDDTYYDITPLQGYVMATVAKSQGRRVVSDGGTYLIDILRDPPGGGSSAYIEAGSKLNYTFNCDVTAKAGMNFNFTVGKGSSFYQGIVGINSEAGTISTMKNVLNYTAPLVCSYYNSWQYSYSFETTERISTSSSAKNVGAPADVYIGMTQNAILEDAVAVRIVPDSLYQRLVPREGGTITVDGHEYKVKNGLVKVLAKGTDVTGKPVYLIRDEVMRFYLQLNSTFAHSQAYIQSELIPTLLNVRSQLMLPPGTPTSIAQEMANKQGCPVYISNLPTTHENYAGVGTYTPVNPTNSTQTSWNDSIQAINRQIATWASFIAQNEMEKLNATDLVKSYDFDGRTSITYSENFSVSQTEARYLQWPFVSGQELSSLLPRTFTGGSNDPVQDVSRDESGNVKEVEFSNAAVSLTMKIGVVASINFNYKFGGTETQSKKAGFTLAMDKASNLVVDVYRTAINMAELKEKAEAGDIPIFNVISQDIIDAVRKGKYVGAGIAFSYFDDTTPQYRNFVYRTRAGSTTSPWEDERVTQFYNPGTVLDVRTLDIDRPSIWAKESTVSNVPYDEPARFTIYLANESEVPSASAPNKFYIMLEDYMNPKGAKVQIDGNPLPGEGHFIYIPTGQVVEKQVEVYAGADFDYEDIGLALLNPDDPARVFVQKLSAHFVPTAGRVNISLPGDKWVVNTESAYDDKKRDYYLPVRIDGFDVNYRGFDHIELQYKLSTQGDKDWVNVCSYYKSDSLMALASGTRELIMDDGFIEARFFGETSPIEQTYDVRAVTFCRHGGGYLTRASEILTGIKDTRRPVPFGTPQPTNGILGIGDDIRIAFSEQIAGNYLRSVNNFEVLGLTNKSNISLETCLQFNRNSFLISQAKRNLAGKDFTLDLMVYPDPTFSGSHTLFGHIAELGHDLHFGIESDNRLYAEITADKVYRVSSTQAVDFSSLHQVAYAVEADEEQGQTTVKFYDGTTLIGQGTIDVLYDGNGPIQLGEEYTGEMLEVRLWNKAMTAGELSKYSQKRLTGYELGLIDYYPMNEGGGEYVYDKAVGGNDLIAIETTWKTPDGICVSTESEPIPLNPDVFNRADYEDYTLALWFNASDTDGGTIISNGDAKAEAATKDHFNLGINGEGDLYFRSGGQEVTANGYYADGQWHHVAVMVNRARNVGSLYVDQQLKATFPVDTLGGISGNHLYLGATFDANSQEPKNLKTRFHGKVDELCMYEMALPENVLKLVATNTPSGEEMGLLAYLPFSRSEKQLDNSQRLMPTGISIKKYKDSQGNIIESHQDTIVAQSVMDAVAVRTMHAPMTGSGKLENIKYSFVADGKDLLINLDVPEVDIEKTNVYITVKEVADLQGNLMASPLVMDLYVYRNPLRWTDKRRSIEARYGEGATLQLSVENLSGKARNFTLEGLPAWITPSLTSGKVAALDEQPVTLTVSPYINIGDYEEVIYIVGEEGMTEPLPISIKVRGEAPDWTVDDNLKAGNVTMHMIAQVKVNGVVSHDSDDILTAIGTGHRTLGTAGIDSSAAATGSDEGLIYLTVYNTAGTHTEPLLLEFYDATTGRIYVVEREDGEPILFQADAILGTPTNPIVLMSTEKEVQTVRLQKGWNWISTYVQPAESTVTSLLDGIGQWEVGDGLELVEPDGRNYLITYKGVYDPTLYTTRYYWDNGDKTFQLDPTRMYRFFAQSTKNIYVVGNFAYDAVTVHKGWNRIGYMSSLNLPIATALADYLDDGNDGDIIKSQSEFAVLSIDSNGNRQWKGTLTFLRSGEGYMLKRIADSDARFFYPYYTAGSRYNVNDTRAAAAPKFENLTGGSMNIIARVEGVELEEGDRLVAYGGAEMLGVAVADEEGRFFLNVAAGSDDITFAIERPQSLGDEAADAETEVVATAPRRMPYFADGVEGTLRQPATIRFVPTDSISGDGWYNLQGIRLRKAPTEPGVYIHNGKKVTIK